MVHDWVAIGLALLSAIVVPAVGVAFISKINQLKSDFEKAIMEMEDRVLAFIRDHETDAFAHPNLRAHEVLGGKLDEVLREIVALKILLANHIAKEEKV